MGYMSDTGRYVVVWGTWSIHEWVHSGIGGDVMLCPIWVGIGAGGWVWVHR